MPATPTTPTPPPTAPGSSFAELGVRPEIVAALRRLGAAGDPVAASQLAARAYADVRHAEPRVAERLNGVMHHLARLETQVALETALDRWPNLRVDPAAAAPTGVVFRKPKWLPVTWDA